MKSKNDGNRVDSFASQSPRHDEISPVRRICGGCMAVGPNCM